MANALILVFASIGILGIILGIRSWRSLSRLATRSPGPQWRRFRFAALLLGIALGVASFFTVMVLSYPVSTPDGPGRIVGWPFFVAYFDSEGRDYVGFLTYVGAFANFLFWLLIPQIFLAAHARRVAGHIV